MGKVGKALRFVRDIPRKTAVGLIRFYSRAISPALPPSCRFLPTCSEYALTAFQRYGFLKGFVLSVKRIGRCHPWNPGGYDPVP
ncbi:MAG: membrane protein insertion efficiency factor YidD [Coriobacteriia bacterium]|nr:membrane protein insertion efficiency factor YidD [Coriobacteriia bacterium]MDR2714088.1 membrane protein insertion efficiency factor YidD [Coriobacteriales bacterium]